MAKPQLPIIASVEPMLTRLRTPLLLLLFSVLAYGLLIPWLGLYWDDWALAWFSHEYSPLFFLGYAPYRPVSGWLYFLSFSLLGESILAWQAYAVFWHWAMAAAFWWLLRLLWPLANRTALVAALVFLLYPGFSQSPISVTYSLYFLYYTLLLISFCLMLLAQGTEKQGRSVLTFGSLVLSAAVLFSTEYFYGLELLRPLLIWIAPGRGAAGSFRRHWRPLLRTWAPYLALTIAAFGWRFVQANEPGALYQTSLLTRLISTPLQTLPTFALTALGDLAEASLVAWARLVSVWPQLQFGSLAMMAYVSLVVLSATAVALLLWPRPGQAVAKQTHLRNAFLLALFALFLGGISFWVAELPLRLRFPWDRFTLPLSFGVALLVAVVWHAIRIPALAKTTIIALVVGLMVGYHFINANSYREEWERQRTLLQQMQWRIPAMQPATALLTVELPLEHYTDNSLTAPLNWIYAAGDTSAVLPHYLAYLDLREDAELFGAGSGVIQKGYRFSRFTGNGEDVLLFYFAPPACLRILDPLLDAQFPRLPQLLRQQVARSNLDRILPNSLPGGTPIPYWSVATEESWCYYYERADLARQQGDWEQVVALGDVAFALEDSPNHPAERIPFIQAYAMVGRWDRSLELTEEALDINPLMQPMLCLAWDQIASQAPLPESQIALEQAQSLLNCSK